MAEIDPLVADIRKMRNDKEAMQQVLDDFHESANAKTSREEDWERFYWQWRGKLRITGKYPLLSRSVLPLSHAYVETAVPFIVDALYDERHFITGIGQEPKDAENAVLIGKYTNYQFTYLMKFIFPLIDTIRASFIYGTAWMKTAMSTNGQIFLEDLSPEDKVNFKTQLIKTPGSGGEWRRIIYDGPRVTYESPFTVFPDHANHEVEDMRFVVHKYSMPLSRLYAQAFGSDGKPLLKNLHLIANTKHPDPGRTEEKGGREAAHGKNEGHGSASMSTEQRDASSKDKMVEVMDWWSPTWVVKLINREIVVFNGPNPLAQIPFTKFTPTRDPGFLYGYGMCESMNSLQNVLNIMHNQKIDIVNLLMNPQWKARRGAAINSKQHLSRPGAVIHVNNMDDVTPLIAQDTTPNIDRNIREIISIAELTTGILDFVRGEEPKERISGAGINLLQRASARRFKLQIKGFQQALIDVISKVHFLNQRFAEGSRIARVIGIDGKVEFTPDIDETMFKETFIDFRPTGKASGGNPEVMAAQLQQLDAQLAGRISPAAENKLIRAIVDLMEVPNLVDFLNDEEGPTPASPTDAPQSLTDLMRQGTNSAPPVDIINAQPSRTNPGGSRLIRMGR